MAASKKTTKGNKTAHVLNLLTGPDASKKGASAGGDETDAAAAAPAQPLPVLEVVRSSDDELAQQIQYALEEELEEELGEAYEVKNAAPPAPRPAPQPPEEEEEEVEVEVEEEEEEGEIEEEEVEEVEEEEEEGEIEEEEVEEVEEEEEEGEVEEEEVEEVEEEEEEGEVEEAEEEVEEEGEVEVEEEEAEEEEEEEGEVEEAEEEEEVGEEEAEEEEDVTYTNVMQVLVEEKAPKYIEQFGLCSCKQCAADVKALALTSLPSKYVVLSRMDRIPMLTVYEGRYSTAIFSQLSWACKTVMMHPHHSREQ